MSKAFAIAVPHEQAMDVKDEVALFQAIKARLVKFDSYWTIKESVRAKLKVAVKRTLRKYGYPPDMQKLATETVLRQAELIAAEIANG